MPTCEGNVITLTATPYAGSGAIFTGWSGDTDCLAVGPVTSVTMDGPRSCTARFVLPQVEVSVTGSGKVVSLDQIESCRAGSPSSECTRTAPSGPEIPFTAIPDPGAALIAWGGDCTGTAGSATLVLTEEFNTCTATFSTIAVGSGSGVTEIVSVADDESLGGGHFGGGNAFAPLSIDGSADLSVVTFNAASTNLLPVPTQPYGGYARNRILETTQQIYPALLSQNFEGSVRTTLSADGRYAGYLVERSSPSLSAQIFWRDLSTGFEQLVSVSENGPGGIGGFDEGYSARISGNGRYVVYRGTIPAYPQNPGLGFIDGLIVRDTCSGAAAAEGCVPHSIGVSYHDDPNDPWYGLYFEVPGISHDGRYVLFHGGPVLVAAPSALYLHDRDADGDGVYDEAAATSTVPVVAPFDSTNNPGPYYLEASGRYVAYHSIDPSMPGNANPPPGGRAYLRDTCTGAPPGCVPSDVLLSVQPDGQPLATPTITHSALLTDVSSSGRYIAFESANPWLFDLGLDPEDFNQPMAVVRDTCLGAPPGCLASNRLVSRRSNGDLVLDAQAPRVSDDGTLAVFLGPRETLIASPNGFFPEVLLSVTGFEPELGGTPTIEQLNPTSASAGSGPLLITIVGTGFVPGATVTWNNGSLDLATIFVSPERLQARIKPTDIPNPGIVHLVRVKNPSGSFSDAVVFNTSGI